MRRRACIALGGVFSLLPQATRAQQRSGLYRMCVLTLSEARERSRGERRWVALFDELRRLGYEEDRNLSVDWRSASGEITRASAAARDVVALKPDVIFTADLTVIAALKAATTSVPMVVIAPDPVAMGFGLSAARPGGNITGLGITPSIEVIAKRVQLLKEAAPSASRIGWLAPRLGVGGPFLGVFRDAAIQLGLSPIEVIVEPPYDEAAYQRAFAILSGERADALYATPSHPNLAQRRLIAEFAVAARLPSMFVFREHVEAGGLMAYGVDLVDLFRRSAGYIARILQGASPAELPFEEPTRFELAINLRTAKTLGLDLPSSLLARADEVIE